MKLKKINQQRRGRKNNQMAKVRACKICKRIYEGDKCPECGSQEYTEESKGRVMIFSPENSEIAQRLKINKTGLYAVKTK